MQKLTVEKYEVLASGHGMIPYRIGGFADGELNELKSMDNNEAKETLLNMLNHRNNGLGTSWLCGYGVFGLWFDNEYAYLNIGTSCD